MAEIKIAGVMRAGAYSPNHIGNDAAIFNAVMEQLRKRGCEVNVYSEEQLAAGAVKENIILNMCREPRSIDILQKKEDQGALVINSGFGLENCIRERSARILLGNDIPYPESLIVNTDEGVKDTLKKKGISQCWIKRGDSHSRHKEDVSYVRHPQEAQEILQEYFLRGIKRAVINRHLEGELIKFYGITGTPFFFWFFHFAKDPSSAQKESIEALRIDDSAIRELCNSAAEAAGIEIYGGDIILDNDGKMWIIDLNDWPTFAPCRQEASVEIAKYVLGRIKSHNSR
ncbi:MAG: hypothetical protein HDS99_04305 [Bacteroidales bacterium]|nr:hypothetical protein [Bacteroidales bacterium]